MRELFYMSSHPGRGSREYSEEKERTSDVGGFHVDKAGEGR